MSTRERRTRPRLIVHTGAGKGKSTAAFGLAARAWGHGWPIAVYQFVKSAKWRIGERNALEALGRVHEQTGAGAPVTWHVMGAGWTWLRATRDTDQAELALAGWRHVAEELAAERHRLYVLDEFSYPLARGWVDVDEVLAALAARPGQQHVVITGRDCPQAVIDAADIVTDMTKVKHPFDLGERGQVGIEW